MKGNKKRFLALGLAVLMAGSPVAHLHAEEGEAVEIISQEAASEPTQEKPASESGSQENTVSDNTVSEKTEADETVEKEETEEQEETKEKEEASEEAQENNQEEAAEEEKKEEVEEADYTSVDAALESIPEDLTIYTEETVNAVIKAKEAVVRGYDKSRQEEVDRMAADIKDAVANLTKKVSVEESELTVNNLTAMFKIVKAEIIKNENGSYSLAITLNGKGYQNLFVGTYEQAVENGDNRANWIAGELVDGKYRFMIPINGSETSISVVSISNNKLQDYENGKSTLERAFYPRQMVIDYNKKTLTAGDFESLNSLTVTNEVKMFSVASAALKTVGGPNSNNYEEVLQLTMGSDSFDKIYVGSAENVATATSAISIENREASVVIRKNVTGGVTEFDYLDKPVVMSFHSVKKDTWYERAFTVSKKNNTLLITTVQENGDNKPGKDDTTGDNSGKPDGDNKSDNESGHVTDLNGGTVRVDSSTTLKDGVYTPDQFSWSGGTGRVSISCDKITIKNGQAYATIVFSSGSYSYIKANGNIYYGANTGSTSTFVVPVQLNKNNTIIGMTTAMSTAHEITYNIFIYLAAAGSGEQGEALNNQKLDQKAPVIMGLTYEEEIEMEYTKYVKLYRYENDIMLLEIDMKTDTEREVLEEETDNLYEGNVVKYLIVPEDVEIPAGLDKNVIIIQRPLEKTYIADEDILELLKENFEIDEELLMEGDAEDPDYKEIVKNKCNLAVLPSSVLEIEKDSKEKKDEKEQLLDLSERFATLQIPVFVDRMADEEKEEAKLEWLKIYGVLFDCEEKANEVYTEKLTELQKTEKKNE